MSTRTTRLDTATPSTFRQNIAVPTYNRRDLLPHTVHIGVGGFHRAHQAVYLDDLLALPDTPRWGEIGVGILPSDDRMRDAMLGQDCLYTLVERSAEQQNARVIGSMTQYLYAPAQREAVLEALASPVTRIVTLTITEGGYFLDEGTGKFNANHPALQHDLANLGAPTSSLGLLAEALDRRRLRNLPAFTLQSCDNLQGNGHITRDVLLGYAALRKPELHDWIAAHVAFPNSMVDRITPATTSADIQWLADRFGIADAWPVVTEPFRQWVIEDTFSNDRPEWERVGAQIVDDVAPYETMKIRLLNGSHEAIAFLGALAGYTFVHEVMQDPLFHRFIEAFMEEVTPVVPVIPGTSVNDYKRTLLQRFLNPTINDQVTRLCSEGSAKIPKWVLPSITELLAQGRNIDLLSLLIAAWIFYLQRAVDERGQALHIVDARAEELRRVAQHGGLDPRPFLQVNSIFGDKLPTDATFVAKVESALQTLAQHGTHAALRLALAATPSPNSDSSS